MDEEYNHDLRIEARLRNNQLWHAIFDRWSSVAQFCREHPALNTKQTQIGRLLNLKENPRNPETGEHKDICVQLSAILEIPVNQLFPDEIYEIETVEAAIEVPSGLMLKHQPVTLLADPDTSPFDSAVQTELQRSVQATLRTLTPREERVIKMRMGIGYEPMTLEEVGATMGYDRERVRVLEEKALKKLKHFTRARHLEPFMPDYRSRVDN